MTHAADIYDRSGNGFHGTGTHVATSTDGPVLVNPRTVPIGTTVLPIGKTTVAQHVIRRYADGANHPAGQLRGEGPGSAIQGSTHGPTDGSDPQVIVVTEDYAHPNGIKQWQSGAFATAIAANVADATASGDVITITTTSNHGRSTGQTVTISDVEGFEGANRTAVITVTSLTTFTLNGTSTTGNAMDNTGQVAVHGYPFTGTISAVTSGEPAVVTTHAPHGLTDGQIVTISGVMGMGVDPVNDTFAVEVTDEDTFFVPVETTSTGSGGIFSFDLAPAVLQPVVREISILGFDDVDNDYGDTGGTAVHSGPHNSRTAMESTLTVVRRTPRPQSSKTRPPMCSTAANRSHSAAGSIPTVRVRMAVTCCS
jgi:hypothetical protein